MTPIRSRWAMALPLGLACLTLPTSLAHRGQRGRLVRAFRAIRGRKVLRARLALTLPCLVLLAHPGPTQQSQGLLAHPELTRLFQGRRDLPGPTRLYRGHRVTLDRKVMDLRAVLTIP